MRAIGVRIGLEPIQLRSIRQHRSFGPAQVLRGKIHGEEFETGLLQVVATIVLASGMTGAMLIIAVPFGHRLPLGVRFVVGSVVIVTTAATFAELCFNPVAASRRRVLSLTCMRTDSVVPTAPHGHVRDDGEDREFFQDGLHVVKVG